MPGPRPRWTSHSRARLAPFVRARRARAFSLLELIIVLAIIGMLAALVLPNIFSAGEDGKVKATRTQMNNLAAAVEQFRDDVGTYPTEQQGLAILLEQPPAVQSPSKVYLQKAVLPKDGWKNDFVYKLDPDFGFDIISYGSDGQPGGENYAADISLREKAQP